VDEVLTWVLGVFHVEQFGLGLLVGYDVHRGGVTLVTKCARCRRFMVTTYTLVCYIVYMMNSEQIRKSTAGVQLVNGEYKPGEIMTSSDWLQLAIVKLLQTYNSMRRECGWSHDAAKAEALRQSTAGKVAKDTFIELVNAHPQDWR